MTSSTAYYTTILSNTASGTNLSAILGISIIGNSANSNPSQYNTPLKIIITLHIFSLTPFLIFSFSS